MVREEQPAGIQRETNNFVRPGRCPDYIRVMRHQVS
jgi:hypothetical protein